MTEKPFYPTSPTVGCLDGSCFPQHDPAALCHSYLPTVSSTELPPSSPAFCPSLSAHESRYSTRKHTAPQWASQPAGGPLLHSKSSSSQTSQLHQNSSALQSLDSFSSTFTNHNFRMFRSTTASLDVPFPFCLNKPTDVVQPQLLSHRPQPTEIQPMGPQQPWAELESQPMSSCDRRHVLNVQNTVQPQPQQEYILQDPYCPLQYHDMNYLLYSSTTAKPATQTSNLSHPIANSIPQTKNPSQTHKDSAYPFVTTPHQNSHSTQLSPPFSSPYSQLCKIQLYSQPEPAPSSTHTHFYYQSHQQDQNQNQNQNQNPYLNQNQQQNQQLSSFPPQEEVQMLREPQPLSCEQYCSDSSCPSLLSPTHLSPVDPSPSYCLPQPLLSAPTCSPHQQNQRTELEFHASAQPQWPQRYSSVQEKTLYQDHSLLMKLMEKDASRLLCSLCQKEFKSLPALNGHMRSHGGGLLPKTPLKVGWGAGPGPEKRSRSHSEPLVRASPSGAVLFQSLLRSPPLLGEAPPYTPPPMLCPTRQGSGLFTNICPGAPPPATCPSPHSPRVLLNRTSSLDSSIKRETMSSEDMLLQIKPRINIGLQFQAVIPEVQRPHQVDGITHKAHLLWSPLGVQEIPTKQRVDALLNMACSSVLPGGGTNTEFALHCLFQCRGDLMATLDRLLLQKPLKHKSDPSADYHYAGSDNWTLVEKKQLNKAFLVHSKDFSLIQKMVKTKTVSQCVEYYYTWKKRLRLGKREGCTQVRLASLGPHATVNTPKRQDIQEEERKSVDLIGFKQEVTVSWSPGLEKPVANEIGDFGWDFLARSSNPLNSQAHVCGRLGSAPQARAERTVSSPALLPALVSTSPSCADADPSHIFPCRECGKVFLKIKSRNAHMKTHRQQDDPPGLASPAAPQPPRKSCPSAPPSPPVNHPAPPARPTNNLVLMKPLSMPREEQEDPVHTLLPLETAGKFILAEEL